MTEWDLANAFGRVNEKFVKETDRLFQGKPTWRYVMTKSIKVVCTTAAVVLTVGIIALVMFLQSGRQSSVPANAKPDDGAVTLRVVTEFATDATHGGYASCFAHDSLRNLISEYEKTHNVHVELTVLPFDTSEREAIFQKMRTEIMAGKGPDVFLLPSGSVASDYYPKIEYQPLEPLFPDVRQCMESRLFADLSEYYDSDKELKTDELKQDIMNAGVYDGKRYVLPIGWNMPIIAVDKERAAKLGMDEGLFSKGVLDIYNAALESNDATSLYLIDQSPDSVACAFPNLFDYDTDALLLTEEEILQYFEVYNAAKKTRNAYTFWGNFTDEMYRYVGWYDTEFFLTGENAFACGDLSHAAGVLGMAQAEKLDVSVLPLRAIDGSTVAEITYFGAVGAGCKHPEEAYQLLRMFLLPEAQFHRSVSTGTLRLWEDDCAWPVRIAGSVKEKYQAELSHINAYTEPLHNREVLNLTELSDDDLPFLQEPIDHVRFATPFSYEFFHTVTMITSDLTPENAQEKAAELIASAKYHIAES